MKRIFCVLLVCALLFSGGTSAIAADSIDDSGQQQGQEQQSTVTVGTLEELQAAVALGWIADSAEFDPDALITRGQLVEFINGVLEQCR